MIKMMMTTKTMIDNKQKGEEANHVNSFSMGHTFVSSIALISRGVSQRWALRCTMGQTREDKTRRDRERE